MYYVFIYLFMNLTGEKKKRKENSGKWPVF